MTDLTKLSNEDLMALRSGDLSKVSNEGLMSLRQSEPGIMSGVAQMGKDVLKGAAVGAAEIGQSILALPKTLSGGYLPPIGGEEFLANSRQATKGLYDEAGPAAGVGKFATQVAGTMGLGGPVAGLAAKGAQMLPRAAGFLKSAPVTGAVEGAAAGLMTDPDGGMGAAGMGAVGGGVGGAVLGSAMKRAASPTTQAASADRLRNMGIDVTAGQGGGRIAQNVEQAASYLPLVSAGVQKQRARPYEQLRDVVMEKSQVPGASVSTAGRSVDDVLEDIRSKYDQAYSQITAGKFFQQDPQLAQDITRIIQDPSLYITEEQRRFLAKLVKAHLWDHTQGGGWVGDTLALAQNEFRSQAAKLRKGNPSPSETELSEALHSVTESIRSMMSRQDPQVKVLYDQLRTPYANLVTAERAAAGALAQGAFTPSQLARAAAAKKNTDLEDLGRLAYTHLPKGAESPTPLGSALGAGALMGGGYLAGTDNLPTALVAPAAILGAFGTRTGQRALTGDFAIQKLLAKFLREHPTSGATVGAITATELGE